MQPLVSIIVPIYNVAPYIIRCLQSIDIQTYRPIECLLIDDCGTDESVPLVEQFTARYNGDIHFYILRHEYNMGLSAARNTGIKTATGDYVYFMDSDDVITPDSIETLVSLSVKYPDADFIQGDIVIGTDDLNTGNIDPDVPEYCNEKRTLEEIILCKSHRTAWNRLLKVNFLLDNRLFFPVGLVMEDHYWTYFVAKKTKTAVFCHKGTYYYYKNSESIINSPSKTSLINRYSSYIYISEAIINDLLLRPDILPFHSRYVGETIVLCMINLVRLHSLHHWSIFWEFAFHTAWRLRRHITWRRLCLFVDMMPPCCFLTNIKGWRWRLRQYLIAKI